LRRGSGDRESVSGLDVGRRRAGGNAVIWRPGPERVATEPIIELGEARVALIGGELPHTVRVGQEFAGSWDVSVREHDTAGSRATVVVHSNDPSRPRVLEET
jgi:hypothetical protein